MRFPPLPVAGSLRSMLAELRTARTRQRAVREGGRPPVARLVALLAAGALVAALLAVPGTARASLGATGLPVRRAATGTAGAPAAWVPFPDGLVHVDGHGWGPGIGMGQWGAFGDAAVGHETYQWILAHFYGGTTLASNGGDPYLSVGVVENTGAPLVVTSQSKFRLGGEEIPAGEAARAVLHPDTGTWVVKTGSSCTATRWKKVGVVTGTVQAVPSSQQPTAPDSSLLTICRADGVDMTVRGLVRGVIDRSGGTPVAQTINLVRLDQYVADVVPSESPAGWGELGGTAGAPQGEPWGFQSLEAQAVAARTYALAYVAAGGFEGWAGICDSGWCQSYPGTANETAISTLAATDTSGETLEIDGSPAPTEYSASTGGWTAPSRFPAVADAGDSVCLASTGYWSCNPDHYWQVTIPVTKVEARFPKIGSLLAVHVLTRNGLGAWGGRALRVKIRGTTGAVYESGDTFARQFDLASNWFLIAHPATSSTAASGAAENAVRETGVAPHFGSGGTGPLPSGTAGGASGTRREPGGAGR
jgi:SpoIID/LytB domain protein